MNRKFLYLIILFFLLSLFPSGHYLRGLVFVARGYAAGIVPVFSSKKKKKRRKKKRRKKRRRRKRPRKKRKSVKKKRYRFAQNTRNVEKAKIGKILNLYVDENYERTIDLAAKLLRDRRLRRAASYYTALSLANLGLYRSSVFYFGEVVKMGIGRSQSTKKYYQQAVNSLLTIADDIDDDTLVPYLLRNVSIRSIGIRQKGKFYYYLGKYYYFTEKYPMAIKTLKKVSSKTPYYSRARYVMGVVYALSKRYKKALGIFRMIARLPEKRIHSEAIRDKANLALARLFYGFAKYRLSQVFYEKITDESPLWMTTVFESAWAYYMDENYNKVLGKLEVINSPFFDDKFEPEFYVLRLVVLLKMCRVLELKPFIVRFNKSYTNMVKPIASYANRYRRDKKKLFETIGNYYLGKNNYFGLPKRLVSHIAMEDAVFTTYFKIYSILDEQEDMARLLKGSLSSSYYERLSNRLTGYVKKMSREVSSRIANRIKYYYNHLGVQIDRARLVRLEYMDEEKTMMERAMVVYGKKDQTPFQIKRSHVSVPEDYIYWPFEGEYWRDELGYHEFRMQNACVVEEE